MAASLVVIQRTFEWKPYVIWGVLCVPGVLYVIAGWRLAGARPEDEPDLVYPDRNRFDCCAIAPRAKRANGAEPIGWEVTPFHDSRRITLRTQRINSSEGKSKGMNHECQSQHCDRQRFV